MLQLSRLTDDPRADVLVEILLRLMNSHGSAPSLRLSEAGAFFDTAIADVAEKLPSAQGRELLAFGADVRRRLIAEASAQDM